MIIIIDAYNVLKQVMHAGHISEIERMRFIKQIGIYSKAKEHSMILVFDGGGHERPTIDRIHGISVVYSGTQTADTYIQHYIDNHKMLDLLLISSDRQICRWAADRNVPSLEAVDFYRLLQDSVKNKKSVSHELIRVAVKTTRESSPQVDALMYETDIEDKHEAERESHARVSQGYRSSKQERHLIKKIKKL